MFRTNLAEMKQLISDPYCFYFIFKNALLDTRSPISLIKISYAKNFSENAYGCLNKYNRINNSKLIILDTVKTDIALGNVMKNKVILMLYCKISNW